MNKLLDLAQLWSGSTLMANDRIELWPLLQRSGPKAEPLARSRKVAVRFRSRSPGLTLATLYGSQPGSSACCWNAWRPPCAARARRRAGHRVLPDGPAGADHLPRLRRVPACRRPPCRRDGGAAPPSKGRPLRRQAGTALTARDQIGLKLCQHVIAMHGGLLREEDEDGLRNFLIDLPTGAPHRDDHSAARHRAGPALRARPVGPDDAARAAARRLTPARRRNPPDPRARGTPMKRVLIVEDQTDIRKLIRMTLEFEDYEIHEAADGATGLRMARDLKPDLMLLDVMMPGELDGLQVCQRAQERGRDAGRQGGAADRARPGPRPRGGPTQAGADEYLVKPFSPLQLIDTIERLLTAAVA
jgi:two-component system, OmpR family, phosphate regulon response regulator PhoB